MGKAEGGGSGWVMKLRIRRSWMPANSTCATDRVRLCSAGLWGPLLVL